MRKLIPKADPTNLPKKGRRGARSLNEAVRWQSRILLYLEAKDPKLLDKETQKVYRKIHGTGARIQGPVPLPVRDLPEGTMALERARIHRRLLRISFPTERTVSLLEKLALSGAVDTAISVEEIPAEAAQSTRGRDVEDKEETVS